MRNENEFLLDVLGRLKQSGIDYMLTGSMATNFWGIPRTTHDLDFVLVLQSCQIPAVMEAFATGFFIQPESVRQVFQPPHQFNILDEQSALKADFWLLRENAFERTAFGRRMSVSLFGSQAWITTAEDIMLHKLYWNQLNPSDRQLTDVAGVYAVQGKSLDLSYLLHWSSFLHVTQDLEKILSGKLKPKST